MAHAVRQGDIPPGVSTVSDPVLNFRSSRLSVVRNHSALVFGTIGVVILLAAWQICAVTGVVDSKISSEPTQVVQQAVKLFGNGSLWTPIGNTLQEVGYALLIIVVLGIPIGILLGRLTVVRQMSDPIVSILNSVPYVLFLP